jgi:hypothetical protein
MATYLELRSIYDDESDLLKKVVVALCVCANDILQGDDTTDPPYDQGAGSHDNRARWAARALVDPIPEGKMLLKAVLCENRALSMAQIQAASDAAVQTNVEALIDGIASALHST